MKMRTTKLLLLFAAALALGLPLARAQAPAAWVQEWPDTDFSRSSVDFEEILSGGPPKDGIPAIDEPRFAPAADHEELPEREPVIRVAIAGEAKAYPLRILMWHEIVNDEVGGVPVAVTYCPLCNAAIVFERELEGRLLDFGTTGKLRYSDLVMYDRQSESWWQQFLGEAIVGELTGKRLTMRPSRIESFASFKAAHPDGLVLLRSEKHRRSYGINPYENYDRRDRPYGFFSPEMRHDVPAMAYVVAVGEEAWTLELLREKGRIEHGDLVLSWSGDTASALEHPMIEEGWNIGDVVVQRRGADGTLADEVYDLTFAFVFDSFRPEGAIYSD